MIASVVFATLNVLASTVIAGIVIFKLTVRVERFTCVERIGMGLAAAGALLTIGPVVHDPSPFDDWSGVLMRVGMATYFIGRITRHRVNNWSTRRDAERHLSGRRA